MQMRRARMPDKTHTFKGEVCTSTKRAKDQILRGAWELVTPDAIKIASEK